MKGRPQRFTFSDSTPAPAPRKSRIPRPSRNLSPQSDAEELAKIIADGARGVDGLEIARQLLARFGSLRNISRMEWQAFLCVPGMGEVAAQRLAAAFGLAARTARAVSESPLLTDSRKVAEFIGPELRAEPRMVMRVILLNFKLRLQHVETIATGTLNECSLRVPEILRPAIVHNAQSFILVHNHPSGDPQPSKADLDLTSKLKAASDAMELRLHDHIIIGLPVLGARLGYFSYRESGLL